MIVSEVYGMFYWMWCGLMKLKDFYVEFFNGHMFRDVDYIKGEWRKFKDAEPRQDTKRLRYKVEHLTDDVKDIIRFKKAFKYFLVDKHHRDGYGQLVHHNSYFKNPSDFHSLQIPDRQYDRLFYDIDKHDSVIDGFKHEINDLKARRIGSDVGYSYKQKLKDIKQVHKKYQEYILSPDIDFLADPYSDCIKVKQYYNDRGTEPVLIFTGGAGFHLNVFFEPVHLEHPKEMALSYLNLIGKKCDIPIDDPDDRGISNLDPAVSKNAVNGNQRTPYSVHDKSGLTGFIIPDDTSYDDLMAMIKRSIRHSPSVPDFHYADHLAPDLLREQILKTDKTAGTKKEIKREQYKSNQSKGYKRKTWTVHVDGIGDVTMSNDDDNLSSDLRRLWDLMMQDGMCHPVDPKDIREHYNRVRCAFPDHEDRNPSAICGKYRYKCFKCCPDGINWYMLIAVTYGIVSPDDIKKDVTPQQKQEIRKVIRKLMDISPTE